jgi:hypothetical protein
MCPEVHYNLSRLVEGIQVAVELPLVIRSSDIIFESIPADSHVPLLLLHCAHGLQVSGWVRYGL